MADGPIRVIVVDDHPVFAESLAAALSAAGVDVIAVADNGTRGVALAKADPPQVILMDYRLPDLAGAALLAALREAAPDAAILVLTASNDERTVIEAMEGGCTGYLTKDQRLEEVVRAIESAAAGEAVFPPAVLGRVLQRMRKDANPGRSETLTARELEVLQLMAEGLANQLIAKTLFLSLNTVRNHVRNVLAKLNAHSKLEAVAVATRSGLIEPPARDQ